MTFGTHNTEKHRNGKHRIFSCLAALVIAALLLTSVPGLSVQVGAAGSAVQIGEACYDSLEEALDALQSGETAVLLQDVTAQDVTLKENAVIDLNGHTLTASGVALFAGSLVDNAGDGVLIVPDSSLLLTKENPQLPLYDGAVGGYRFFAYDLVPFGTKVGENNVKFYFRPDFADQDAYALLANTDVQLHIRLYWGDNVATYSLTPELLRSFGALAQGVAGKNAAVILTVSGLENLAAGTKLAAVPVLNGTYGTEQTGTAINYYVGAADSAFNQKPEITGVQDLTVEAGTEIDVLAGVGATDAEDGALTDIQVTAAPELTFADGKVTPENPGTYTLTYTATDKSGESVSATATLTVTEKPTMRFENFGTWTEGALTPIVREDTATSMILTSTNAAGEWWKVKLEHSFATEAGKTYQVKYTFTSNATGNMKFYGDNMTCLTADVYQVVAGNNTFAVTFTAGTSNAYSCLELGDLGAFRLEFTSIALEEVETSGEHEHSFVNGVCSCGEKNGFESFGIWTESALTPMTREDTAASMILTSTNAAGEWWKVKLENHFATEAGKLYRAKYVFTSNAEGNIKFGGDNMTCQTSDVYYAVVGENTFTVTFTVTTDNAYNCLELGDLNGFRLEFTQITLEEIDLTHTHSFVNGVCECGVKNDFEGFTAWTEDSLTPIVREDTENTMRLTSSNASDEWWKVKLEWPLTVTAGKEYEATFTFTADAAGRIKYSANGATYLTSQEYDTVAGVNTFGVRFVAGEDTYSCLELGGLGAFCLEFSAIALQEIGSRYTQNFSNAMKDGVVNSEIVQLAADAAQNAAATLDASDGTLKVHIQRYPDSKTDYHLVTKLPMGQTGAIAKDQKYYLYFEISATAAQPLVALVQDPEGNIAGRWEKQLPAGQGTAVYYEFTAAADMPVSELHFQLGSCSDGVTNNVITIDNVEFGLEENGLAYEISFDGNYYGSPAYEQQTVVAGKKLFEPAQPAREGYVLVGWYQDAAMTRAWNFAQDRVTSDMTLYALWDSTAGGQIQYPSGDKDFSQLQTPDSQEAAYDYNTYFLPEKDWDYQGYVGDTMPYYENGVYYIYYLKEGGDSYNHSIYLTTTRDFVTFTDHGTPVLEASRDNSQDGWIGTGSVVKVKDQYYLFYTGHTPATEYDYRERIMVAVGDNPYSFTKKDGWYITPPSSLNQNTDFRDPQAYYDSTTGMITLTITACQDGLARVLRYTVSSGLTIKYYNGILFTESTGQFWNLECTDTFRIGNTWYLTYTAQNDTLWYATSNSQYGSYSAPKRLEGGLFYAARHVSDGENTYMVGWAKRSHSPSYEQALNAWGGNLVVQKIIQKENGELMLAPVDALQQSFATRRALLIPQSHLVLQSGGDYSFGNAFTCYESFKLTGEFSYTGNGSFGLCFDWNSNADNYKLISISQNQLALYFDRGNTLVAQKEIALEEGRDYTFTYIQDGSVGVFYIDGVAALTVRLYGTSGKNIMLFARDSMVRFTSLRQYTK